MRLLISSHLFAPSIGGIEQVTALLADEFVARGHEVRLVTQTEARGVQMSFSYPVVRRPSPYALVQLLRWCDVYFQSNLSIGTLWPVVFCRRPTVVSYHTWLTRPDGSIGWRDRAKRFLSSRLRFKVAVSEAIADSLPGACAIIANPYRDDIFIRDPAVVRDRELVFVGRLVSDKGVDLLLQALGQIEAAPSPRLTVVGSGPEESRLRQLAGELGLWERVEFVGAISGAPLARILNRHRVIVVPSRWREPFGLVALEGLACGCTVVATASGGLPEAAGPGGLFFEPGNMSDLADKLRLALTMSHGVDQIRPAVEAHLSAHVARRIAGQYLQVFQAALGRGLDA